MARRFELENGVDDTHIVLLDNDGAWWGWENLYDKDDPMRLDKVNEVLAAAAGGKERAGRYGITELWVKT